MEDLSGVGDLTLDDLAALKDSPVAEELAKLAEEIDEEQRSVNGFTFSSYI